MKIYHLINLLEDIELRRVFRHLKKSSTIVEEACLSDEEKERSSTYWKQYGMKLDAIDFKNIAAYKLCRKIYKPSFFPSYYFYTHIKTYLNDQNTALILGNKALCKGLLPDLNHPHLQLSRISGSPLLDENYDPISWDNFVASLDDKATYLFKPGLGTTSCKGIKVFTKSNAISVKEDAEKIPNFVIQRFLKESKVFAPFKSSSLATIRIYTLYYGDRPEVTASCLRIEQTNKMILSPEGELYIAINRDGVLTDAGFNNNLDHIIVKDEINGFKFAGFRIPTYQKVVDAALKAALRYKSIKFIGWDFALGKNDEPVFIECNLEQSGAGLLQVCAHEAEPFGKHTVDILSHAFKHRRY
ncbi:MAG: hypothetical protein EOM74_00440 [Methanomicrobia archaeon]|nr:hypothetical protein [Methanomicrobia archaeon]